MLRVDEWAEVRRLHFSEGMGIRAIARQLGIARNTVREAVRSAEPPRYERESRGSVVDGNLDEIRRLLKGCPTMPATVIAERIGWAHGLTVLKERVRELRPLYLPPQPFQRTSYRPGELAQWDLWQPDVAIPIGGGRTAKLWVIAGAAGYSRWLVGHMIPSRAAHDVLAGHLACLRDLGAVPRTGVYDNESAIGRNVGGVMRLAEEFQRFRGALGMGVVLLERGHPERKGLIERANGYFETSFLPGRSFEGPEDFNAQFKAWLERANHRHVRRLECRPADRIAEDRAAMLALPPVLPEVAWRDRVRLGRDHYVRFETCDYSVDPRMIGRLVDVRADLEWVSITCEGREVGRHRRSLVPHRTLTNPAHARARRELRERGHQATPEVEIEERDLSVYDAATGVA